MSGRPSVTEKKTARPPPGAGQALGALVNQCAQRRRASVRPDLWSGFELLKCDQGDIISAANEGKIDRHVKVLNRFRRARQSSGSDLAHHPFQPLCDACEPLVVELVGRVAG
jgi:hypothetical protein